MKKIFYNIIFPVFLVLGICLSVFSADNKTRSDSPVKAAKTIVYIIPIHGVIDLALSGFIGRISNEMKKEKVELIVLDINTSGGREDAVNRIYDSMMKLDNAPTAAYINEDAREAGALIALMCKNIIMTPGSSIGFAGEEGDVGEELNDGEDRDTLIHKFKSAAKRNGHSAKIVGAMIDKNIGLRLIWTTDNKVEILTDEEWVVKDEKYKKKVKSETLLCKKGQFLNLSANDAKDLGLAKEIVDNKEQLFALLGINTSSIVECKLSWQEISARLITYPLICSFLLTIGFLGFIFELRLHGWGTSGTVGLMSFILFFWAHHFVGLAGWREIGLFLLGFSCLLLKVFFLQGFVSIGGVGIIIVITSLFFSLIKNPFDIPYKELLGAVWMILYSFLVSLFIAVIGLKLLTKSEVWKKLIPPKTFRN